MYQVDGRLVSFDPKARAALETAVAAATGTRLTPRGQCQEYWVIGRRDWPMLYFVERLAAASTAKEKPKGALSSELAALLVTASQPKARDVFLDPFAGSGAIVRGQAAVASSQGDLQRHPVGRSSSRRQGLAQQGCVALDDDALVLPSVASGSVDAIVTDPPWGEYGDGLRDYSKFASEMAASLTRVLACAHGRAVFLVNRRNTAVLEKALSGAGLRLDAPVEILVNGHPATVVRGAAAH